MFCVSPMVTTHIQIPIEDTQKKMRKESKHASIKKSATYKEAEGEETRDKIATRQNKMPIN